jgi:hypothetical protein
MPTIKKPNQHFDATLWTGTGSTQSITNAGGFQPDFVWSKRRNGIASNILIDSIVGGNPPERYLSSDTTSATTANADVITALNNNGFTVGTSGALNGSTNTYVGWQWKAGGASTVNTSGTISSNVSVNTTAGFSVVTYTGTGSNATVGHGLGVVPKMMIVKNRGVGTTNWLVYHSTLTGTSALYLNTTEATQTFSDIWNNTAPTSTVISLGTTNNANASANTYVAYCFAEVEGYSKFGSYTGNASTDGPFVFTGFLPKYILIKRTDTTASWVVMDTSRGLYNASYYYLLPNSTDADSGPIAMDFLSNGFKLRLTSAAWNASGGTYIYMAFAEAPFKYSNAR